MAYYRSLKPCQEAAATWRFGTTAGEFEKAGAEGAQSADAWLGKMVMFGVMAGVVAVAMKQSKRR